MSVAKIPVFDDGFVFSSLREASAVEPVELATSAGTAPASSYTATLARDWCIGFVPQGGYLTTILLRASHHFFTTHAAVRGLAQPHAVHVAQTYFTRCSPGLCRITITALKTGRGYSFVRATLAQGSDSDGALCLEAVITHANLDAELAAGVHLPTPPVCPPIPPRAQCHAWSPVNDSFRPAAWKLLYRFPGDPVAAGSPHSPAVREQWVSPVGPANGGGERAGFGIADLGYLADMFLPLPENYAETQQRSWYPTLSLTLDVKRAPPPGGWEWLFMRIESRVIRGGRMDIDVLIFDDDANVVALSRHAAIVVSRERNRTKQRL